MKNVQDMRTLKTSHRATTTYKMETNLTKIAEDPAQSVRSSPSVCRLSHATSHCDALTGRCTLCVWTDIIR